MDGQLNFAYLDEGDLAKRIEEVENAIQYAIEDGSLTIDEAESMSIMEKLDWVEARNLLDNNVY